MSHAKPGRLYRAARRNRTRGLQYVAVTPMPFKAFVISPTRDPKFRREAWLRKKAFPGGHLIQAYVPGHKIDEYRAEGRL